MFLRTSYLERNGVQNCFFRNSFKLHLSPFEREGIKQWIGSNRSGDTLGGKREWAASVASWRSEKRAFVLSRGGGELGLEEEEVESLAGGAGCQGQEQARRAAIRLLETICTCTATTCQHTALSVWHGWAK